MHIQHTWLYRIRDVAEHPAVSVATSYSVMESGTLAALMFGAKTATLRASGAAVLACAQATGELRGIDYARVVVVA
ncbi:MAG: DNA-binding protein [Pseudonocardiales bacterium]|nr:DNA-binding protein [Pseudonocardiales bacterium]